MLFDAFGDEAHWEGEVELEAGGGGVSLMEWHAADLGDRRVRRNLKNIPAVLPGLYHELCIMRCQLSPRQGDLLTTRESPKVGLSRGELSIMYGIP